MPSRRRLPSAESDEPFAPHEEEHEEDAADSDDMDDSLEKNAEVEEKPAIRTRSGRVTRPVFLNAHLSDTSEDSDDGVRHVKKSIKLRTGSLGGFVAPDDDEDEDQNDEEEFGVRRSTRSSNRLRRGGSSNHKLEEIAAKKRAATNGKASRASRLAKRKSRDDDFEHDGGDSPEEEHISGAEDDPLDLHSDEPEGSQGKSYSLRQRKKVNYSLVPPPSEPLRNAFGKILPSRSSSKARTNGAYELDGPDSGGPGSMSGMPLPFPGRGKKGKEGWNALPTTMSGKDYAAIFGDNVDSSDEELQNNPMRKPGAPAPLGGGSAGGLLGAGGVAGAAGPPGGLTGAGGTDSFGRIKKSGDPLADIDPLGVDMNINFDSVGGLDGHIQQLKEMVMLPLLYPEVFQRFKVTPPRGVLFHGPPGTGKTLVARALAASCSTEGQQVSFFMRKGADCLSKWVGEAERQLRLLFEEARNSQPSIIFFDEIDGLAPVRSSKQDQIHASIVSTMLALMDGMDGRGQVVVIGATNRPDSVDPALRRPGRFDREFYFPLPSLEARKSIINIHTSKWEPPLDESFKSSLAEVTKGYGGADLRALCTEAALNAIQRRYPQIYSTTDRLLLDPASIQVDAKDFMMSVNKIVASSARATASSAARLPERLVPLLGPVVDHAIAVLDKLLPPVSKRNPLEEALYEDDVFVPNGLTSGLSAADMLAGDRGFGREMLLQSFEAQRVYRPRMLVHGGVGMGQSSIGAALLQHLEGFHVQSMDVGTLLGDSARTPEAAVIQLFVEAKRHKPSVLYIPGLIHWSRSVSESVKTTFKALLDGLTDADPVMLLGIAESPIEELDEEIRSWFNFLEDDVVEVAHPSDAQRQAFFQEIFDHAVRPPTEFPDALPRRKRVLEELPKAPPRPPRKLTQAELQQQAESDTRLLEHLKYRLGPVLAELRKKFKKFTRDVWDEYNLRDLTQQFEFTKEKGKFTIELRYYRPGATSQANDAQSDVDDVPPPAQEVDMARGITAAQFMSQAAAANEQNASESNVVDALPSMADDVDMAHIAPPFTNGHADSQDLDAPGSSPVIEGNAFSLVSQPNGTQEAETTAVIDVDGTINTSTGGADDAYVTRSMPIWTMTLEKMQKRLYYNAYLTCADFMADIQKIVENAEEAAEVDKDRVFKAHQMRNLAIILMDQYIDAGFREECDRMAQRQVAREQEAKGATEKAKASAEETAKKAAEAAKGERSSARIAGKEPDVSASVDLSAIERGNKRQRSVSGLMGSGMSGSAEPVSPALVGADESEIGAEDPRKRARMMDIDYVTGNASPAADRDAPGTDASVVPADVPTLESLHSPIAVNGAPEPAGELDPPSHPPFSFDTQKFVALQEYVLRSTAISNIDQLSRLRAACFNAIWSHRSHWNRDTLLTTLLDIARKSEIAVQRERRSFSHNPNPSLHS